MPDCSRSISPTARWTSSVTVLCASCSRRDRATTLECSLRSAAPLIISPGARIAARPYLFARFVRARCRLLRRRATVSAGFSIPSDARAQMSDNGDSAKLGAESAIASNVSLSFGMCGITLWNAATSGGDMPTIDVRLAAPEANLLRRLLQRCIGANVDAFKRTDDKPRLLIGRPIRREDAGAGERTSCWGALVGPRLGDLSALAQAIRPRGRRCPSQPKVDSSSKWPGPRLR
jgi:hypothetical protein